MGTTVRGKLGENTVIAKLLRTGLDVYLPTVDRGTDCVIKSDTDFFEIQIKTRASRRRGGNYYTVKKFEPRDNYFIICHDALTNESFVLPSKVFHDLSRVTYDRRVKRSDKLRLGLTGRMRMRLILYRDNFEQFKKGGRRGYVLPDP